MRRRNSTNTPDPAPGTTPDLTSDPTPTRTLGSTAMRGIATSAGGQFARVLIQLISVTVLARLVSPSDYGLLAMVLVVVGVGEIFRDFGLSSAAIQAKNLSAGDRNGLFWVNTAIGVVLGAALFLGAPAVAAFYDQPELADLSRVLSVTFLLNGAVTQYRAGLTRELRFGALVAVDVFGQVVGTTVAIVLALMGAGVGALAAQQIGTAATALVVAMFLGRWLPGRPSPLAQLRGYVSFGWNLALSQLVGYGANNIDNLIIGLRMGSGPLGLYNRTFQLLMQSYNMAREPINRVALPVFSRLQDEPARFDRFLLRAQLGLGYLLVVALCVAAGLAEPIVGLLLGDDWSAAVPLWACMAIAAGFMTLSFVGYWVYVSRGLTKQLLQYSFVSAAIRIVCILVGARYGLLGVAVGYAVSPMLAWPVSLGWLSRCTPIPLRDLYAGAFRILIVSACAGSAAFAVVQASGAWALPSVALMFVQVFLGGLASLAVVAVAGWVPPIRRDLGEVVEMLKMVRR